MAGAAESNGSAVPAKDLPPGARVSCKERRVGCAPWLPPSCSCEISYRHNHLCRIRERHDAAPSGAEPWHKLRSRSSCTSGVYRSGLARTSQVTSAIAEGLPASGHRAGGSGHDPRQGRSRDIFRPGLRRGPGHAPVTVPISRSASRRWLSLPVRRKMHEAGLDRERLAARAS